MHYANAEYLVSNVTARSRAPKRRRFFMTALSLVYTAGPCKGRYTDDDDDSTVAHVCEPPSRR